MIKRQLDIAAIFDADNMDEATILCLFDAAANVEIARHFATNEAFQQILLDLETACRTDPIRKVALDRLTARVEGWKAFEDAFTNAKPDYDKIIAFVLDLTSEEFSLGCWLECILNLDIFSKALRDDAITPIDTGRHPVRLLQGERPSNYADFVGFVRALVGVSCVLAVVAWADSTGRDVCRERALATLVLWQGINGYREVSAMTYIWMRVLTRVLDSQQGPSIATVNASVRLDQQRERSSSQILRSCRALARDSCS